MASAAPGDQTIADLEVTTYRIPTDAPESDGTLKWDHTDMVVVLTEVRESHRSGMELRIESGGGTGAGSAATRRGRGIGNGD